MNYLNVNPQNHNNNNVNSYLHSNSNICESVFQSNHVFFNNFQMVHQNIRSLRKNFDLLLSNLQSFDKQPDIIFLSEIWIYDCEKNDYNIPGYNFFANCNDTYSSGGVAVFIKIEFNFEVFNYSLGSE